MKGRRRGSRVTERVSDWMRIILTSLALLFFSAGPVVAQSLAGTSERYAYNLIEEALARSRGEQIYVRACAACHGDEGDGKGPGYAALDPRPSDFSSGVFKFRSTPTGDLPTVDDLMRTIRNGVPRTMMPSWQDLLSERELHDVAMYVRTFAPYFDDDELVPSLHIPAEPTVTEIVFGEGKYLYMLMDCWTCHGARGTGSGHLAGTLKDATGRKIDAFDFTRGGYKGGDDNESIFRTFNTGMDGTPMPSYAGVFLFGSDSLSTLDDYRRVYSDAEIQALRAYFFTQPTDREIELLNSSEKQKLDSRRKWSLVYFVKSLARKQDLFYRLFKHDDELTH